MRREFKVLIYYIFYALACYVAESISPSSAHGPGISALVFILLFVVSLFIFLYDLNSCITDYKKNSWPLIVHILVWTIFILFVKFY